MNCIYTITITPCPPRRMQPIINALDSNIFKPKRKTKLSIQNFRKPSPRRNPIDEEITKKIRQHSPFKEIWRELIKPNFVLKEIEKS